MSRMKTVWNTSAAMCSRQARCGARWCTHQSLVALHQHLPRGRIAPVAARGEDGIAVVAGIVGRSGGRLRAGSVIARKHSRMAP